MHSYFLPLWYARHRHRWECADTGSLLWHPRVPPLSWGHSSCGGYTHGTEFWHRWYLHVFHPKPTWWASTWMPLTFPCPFEFKLAQQWTGFCPCFSGPNMYCCLLQGEIGVIATSKFYMWLGVVDCLVNWLLGVFCAGWFAKDPVVLREVGHILLQLPFMDVRQPRRFLIADDCFNLSIVPNEHSLGAVIRSVQRLLGRTLCFCFSLCCSVQMFVITTCSVLAGSRLS